MVDVEQVSCDVAIVGAGPSGLAAATALRRAGVERVLVLEREAQAGGIPRHACHQGFGIRDLGRVLSGPSYAARHVDRALRAGAVVRTESQVTGWHQDGTLEVTSPRGRERVRARAVVLATGCRERPRAARLIPGTRPQGVMNTGTLQQLVYLHGVRPGRRAVVVGAEHVSASALLTLEHGGARAVAMVTELSHHQTFGLFRIGVAIHFRTPLLTRTAVSAIHGARRVEAVELTDMRTGVRRVVGCDLVVFTADWIPDHELALLAGATLDPGTAGPQVDGASRTTREGVFAVGNVLHAAEQADVAALSGRRVAPSVLAYLDGAPWPVTRVPVTCLDPLRWIAPNAVSASAEEQRHDRRAFAVRAHEELIAPRVELRQDGRVLWTGRLPRVMAGRSARLPSVWTTNVDARGGAVVARVVSVRRRR